MVKRISPHREERDDLNRYRKRNALAPVSEMRGQEENQNLRGHRTTNFPLYCARCKEETKLGVIKLQIVVSDEPDA